MKQGRSPDDKKDRMKTVFFYAKQVSWLLFSQSFQLVESMAGRDFLKEI
jgi:hypothetical protein